MPYRDDEEAALARADALDDELERTKRELEETKAKLAEAERKREEAPKPAPPAEPVRPAAVAAPRPKTGATINATAAILIVIGVVIVLVWVNRRHGPAPEPEWRDDGVPVGSCTLESDPPGAEVVAVIDFSAIITSPQGVPSHEERVLGRTPLTRSNAEWNLGAAFELRLSGYRTATVTACGGVVHLTRQ